jgi:SAM-dependent methyltransferase
VPDALSRRDLFRLAVGREEPQRPAPRVLDPAVQAELAARFESGAEQLLRTLEPLAPMICDAAAIAPGEPVLDAAAGDGNVAFEAARRGARVTAVDLAPGMVRRGRARGERLGLEATWQTADVEALPFDDGRFEAVLSVLGTALAARPLVALHELLRVLARPGRLVLALPTRASLSGRAAKMSGARPCPLERWGGAQLVSERLRRVEPSAHIAIRPHRHLARFDSGEAAWAAYARPFGLGARSRDRFLDQLAADSLEAGTVTIEERWLVAIVSKDWVPGRASPHCR